MTLTEAINIFLHKSIMEGGLPFAVRQPRYAARSRLRFFTLHIIVCQEWACLISWHVLFRKYDG